MGGFIGGGIIVDFVDRDRIVKKIIVEAAEIISTTGAVEAARAVSDSSTIIQAGAAGAIVKTPPNCLPCVSSKAEDRHHIDLLSFLGLPRP